MRKRLTVNTKHASYKTIKNLYTSEKNFKIKTILHLFEGKSSVEISLILKQSDATIKKTIHRYNNFGLDWLKDLEHPIRRQF